MTSPSSAASTTATTHGARDHARSQAELRVLAMPTVPATDATDLPPGVAATDVVWDEIVAAGGYSHRRLGIGVHVRLTDLDGDACAALCLHSAIDPSERLNVADTVKVQWQAYPGAGSLLLSDRGRVLATIVERHVRAPRGAVRLVDPGRQRGPLRRRRRARAHALGP